MRLLFVCRMFDGVVGGVERMSVMLMNSMVERGHDVSLFTWDHAAAQAYYPMHESIRWYRLDMGDPAQKAGAGLRFARMRRFRSWATSPAPDAVVAFQHGAFLFAAASLLVSRVPVVLAERNAPQRFDHTSEGRHRRLRFASMRLAAAITVQFESYVERYPAWLRERIVTIHNPVPRPQAFATPGADKSAHTLLSVGRLSYQKNLSTLVRAFAALADDCPDWNLRLVGDGDERGQLEQLVASLGLESRVAFPGSTRDTSAEYRAADLFCLPSRWEGFPNAVAEAMAHGLPVVGFRDCAGMSDLIRPGRDGALADGNGNVQSLSSTLKPLMTDSAMRVRLGLEARRVAEVYPPQRSFDDWERLLQKIARAS